MLFSYNWLQSFFKKQLPKPEKLAELLTMHSFEVEGVKKTGGPARNAFGIADAGGDFVLDIDVLPNRAPDCFSHRGIAREISAITGLKYFEPSVKFKEIKNLKAKNFIDVEVRDKIACSRYSAKIIKEVKVGPSPSWLKEKLIVCGLRPINNIVDITNYVMLETGQPLHAFDFLKIESGQSQKSKIKNQNYKSKVKSIIVRRAKRGEKIATLDNEKYDLDENILVIADEKNSIAIAGIKGGKNPEIDEKTQIIVLESANFDRQVIRRGSKILNLKTDASIRFEQGIDPNLAESAINRAAFLIQKVTGGKIVSGLIDVYPKKVYSKKIKLDLDYTERLLGVKIPKMEIKKILESLGFKIKPVISPPVIPSELSKNWKLKIIEVEVSIGRLDISLPEDLIEEIGRIYGYEKINSAFPISALIPPKRNLDIFWEDMTKNILKEAGFTEVYNYSFFSEKTANLFGYEKKELIELENPLSEEQKYLRTSLIPNLLKNAEKNSKHFSDIRIFELGKIFRNLKDKKEERILSGLMTGDAFYRAKGVMDLLFNKLGISNIFYDEYKPTPEESKIFIWQPKKCAEIKINTEEVGFLGEISPKILNHFKIANKLVFFDINFEKLSEYVSEEHEYRPISKYPSAVRDLAVLVPRPVKVEEVLNKIETAGGLLIRDIDLFDIYEGEELPDDKKNLAFHIVYQAEDKTLSSEEIDKIQNKIIKSLEENPDWQVRR